MNKMGRPKADNPRDKRITIRLDNCEYEQLVEYANERGITVTQAIMLCLKEKIFK